MKLIEQHQIFGGLQQVWAHDAQTLQCEIKFASICQIIRRIDRLV